MEWASKRRGVNGGLCKGGTEGQKAGTLSQSEAGAWGHPVRRAQVHAIALPPEVVASPGAKRDTLIENRSWQEPRSSQGNSFVPA